MSAVSLIASGLIGEHRDAQCQSRRFCAAANTYTWRTDLAETIE